jgi:ATP-dependent RNA helicase RhlB
MRFDELDLHPNLLRAIAERGYTELTDVQERTLAETLRGIDVAVQSQTGTGKTAAFLITIYEALLKNEAAAPPRALILSPTRELAVQIETEAGLLNRHLGFTVGAFYGGTGYTEQHALLRKGVDIAVGTPGRLLDLSGKGRLLLEGFDMLVIDEADRLLDMGFLPDIKEIVDLLPPAKNRQSMLFSATLSRLSQRVAVAYMNNPVFVTLTPEQLTVDTVNQELYKVKSHIKTNLLLGILQNEKPRNALIFTNMRHTAARLGRVLRLNGLSVRYLSGDLPQSKRLKIIDDFMAGKFPFLVATDVAARGLHIEGLEMVINFDLPQDTENYVHRIGRTARAGKTGKAVSFACEKFGGHLDAIETFLGSKIPLKEATIDMFARDKSLEYDAGRPPRRADRGRPRSGPRNGGRRKR